MPVFRVKLLRELIEERYINVEASTEEELRGLPGSLLCDMANQVKKRRAWKHLTERTKVCFEVDFDVVAAAPHLVLESGEYTIPPKKPYVDPRQTDMFKEEKDA